MKVRELIKYLKQFPQEIEVLRSDENGLFIGEIVGEVIHAAEDGDCVVREKVKGRGTDYLSLG